MSSCSDNNQVKITLRSPTGKTEDAKFFSSARTPNEKLKNVLDHAKETNSSSPNRQRLVVHIEAQENMSAEKSDPEPTSISTAEIFREKSTTPEIITPSLEVEDVIDQKQQSITPRLKKIILPKSKFEQRNDLAAFLKDKKKD